MMDLIESDIKDTINILKMLETRHSRETIEKEDLELRKKHATEIFRSLLKQRDKLKVFEKKEYIFNLYD